MEPIESKSEWVPSAVSGNRPVDLGAAFAERVRSGEQTGLTGGRIRHVVNFGIGGSDRGPTMAHRASRSDSHRRLVSNVDPSQSTAVLVSIDPAETLFASTRALIRRYRASRDPR